MKVLIVGRGVVGTIYGWALSTCGTDVTHVVRRQDLPPTDSLDLLDLRPGRPRHNVAEYTPKTISVISASDRFDVVIVATKHYQAVHALHQYIPDLPDATVLLFTANWDGTDDIDRILPRSRVVWGYAKSTGGVDSRGIVVATVDPGVRIGTLQGYDLVRFHAVRQLFEDAGFTLEVKANIIHWLWVHHAINAGGIGVSLWAGGIGEATRNLKTTRLGVWAIRDALRVVSARGVNPEAYPEARSILHTPTWISGLVGACNVRFTEKGRRLLRASHFSNSAEEMKRFYFDVLNAGERLGVPMPHLSSLRERVESWTGRPMAE